MTDGPARRPRFGVNPDNAFWLEGAARGQLRIQRCTECGVLRHPPRPMCHRCQSLRWGFVVSGGRGRVHSYAVHHHPPLPGLRVPNTIVLVDLDEGARVVGDLFEAEHGSVSIGMAVEVMFWADPGDDMVLPHWRPAR